MSRTGLPIASVAQAEREAKRRLPKPVYMSTVAGCERGVTIEANVKAFDEVGFRIRVAHKLAENREQHTTFLGQELSLPVVISPVGVQAIDPGGEVPAARAAAKAGTAIGHSNFASSAFEEVVAANPKAFFQLYWIGSRDVIVERVERMRRAGAKALIVTIDAISSSMQRDWGAPSVPDRVNLGAMIKYAPMALSRPGWVLRFMRNGGLPALTVPNLASSTQSAPTFLEGMTAWSATPLPTWDDLHWLRELWGGPFMLKGIFTPDDARRAVDIGATAISVSNHGGNSIDGTPSALRVLPAIADAVGDDIEIAYDGGIRRGGDVVKALALGADVAMIGRAFLWGLAARGEQGVSDVLELFREAIDKTLFGLGRSSIHELERDDVYLPEGFEL